MKTKTYNKSTKALAKKAKIQAIKDMNSKQREYLFMEQSILAL